MATVLESQLYSLHVRYVGKVDSQLSDKVCEKLWMYPEM